MAAILEGVVNIIISTISIFICQSLSHVPGFLHTEIRCCSCLEKYNMEQRQMNKLEECSMTARGSESMWLLSQCFSLPYFLAAEILPILQGPAQGHMLTGTTTQSSDLNPAWWRRLDLVQF